MLRDLLWTLAFLTCALTSAASAEPPLLVPHGIVMGWWPRLQLSFQGSICLPISAWQLSRGLNEGSVVLAREAFSAEGIQRLSVAL